MPVKSKKEKKKANYGYSTLQNMAYVMKHTFKLQKVLLPFLIIYAFTEASMAFIWPIISSLVIKQVSLGVHWHRLLYIVLITTTIEIVLMVTNTCIKNQTWWRFIDARQKFISVRMRKVLTMDYEKLEQPEMLDLNEKAGNATGGNDNGVEGMMHSAMWGAVNFVKIFASISIIITLSPFLLLIMLSLSLLHFIAVDKTKKVDKKKTWDVLAPFWRKINYMNYTTSDFSYAKDIRLFSMKSWLFEKHKSIHGEAHRKIVESKNRWMKTSALNQGIGLIQEGVLYAWIVVGVFHGSVSIANAVLYLGVVRTFSSTVSSVLDNIADIRNQSEQVNDFRAFIEYPEEKSALEALPLPTGGRYEIRFENVSFRYSGQEKFALKNMNITIKPGERLAVVGLNGAGKTTFIKLLCRLYEPTEGRILLNGIDIRSFDKAEYFTLFSPVFQNVEIFAFPISENVSMQTPEETDCEKAFERLKDAGMEEKINSLADGVKTQMLKVLYDEGVDFSGGEKQKLALARALYKDAPIVVLDEPTSALDALAEYKLYSDFDKLIGEKSAVYISHRLSSTRFCDAVAMFAGGQLIEYGTHKSLLEKGGEYAKMFSVQAQYYKDNQDSGTESEVALNV